MNEHQPCVRRSGINLLFFLVAIGLGMPTQPALSHDGASGALTTNNTQLINTSWQTLLVRRITLDRTHFCVANGSADFQRPTGQIGVGSPNTTDSERSRYSIGLSLNTRFPPAAMARTVEFTNGSGRAQPRHVAVSTTGFFRVPAGEYRLRLRARKQEFDDPNVAISDASMSVTCFHQRLDGSGFGDVGNSTVQ